MPIKFENPAIEEHALFVAMNCDHVTNSDLSRRVLKKPPTEDRLYQLCKLMYGSWEYDTASVWKCERDGRGTRYTYMDVEDPVRTTVGFEERDVGQWELGDSPVWVIQSVDEFVDNSYDHE